jgi:chromosome segregation ATPase
MTKLLAIITAAIAFIGKLVGSNDGLKEENKKLRKTNEDQSKTLDEQSTAIVELKRQHDEDAIDDEALEKARTDAEAAALKAREEADEAKQRLEELDQVDVELKEAGAELARIINETDDVPETVDEKFKATV